MPHRELVSPRPDLEAAGCVAQQPIVEVPFVGPVGPVVEVVHGDVRGLLRELGAGASLDFDRPTVAETVLRTEAKPEAEPEPVVTFRAVALQRIPILLETETKVSEYAELALAISRRRIALRLGGLLHCVLPQQRSRNGKTESRDDTDQEASHAALSWRLQSPHRCDQRYRFSC
jgi:hypothetical protein